MSLIEQAAKRLEQLRQAGVELPEPQKAIDNPAQIDRPGRHQVLGGMHGVPDSSLLKQKQA